VSRHDGATLKSDHLTSWRL